MMAQDISGNTETLLLGTMQYTTSYNDVEGFGSKYVAARLDLTMGVFNNAFPNQINEIGEVIKAVKDDPAKVNLYAEARIWKVFCFSRITDLYGDIPYTQAGQGYNESIYQPAYDAQKDIYADMLKELDEAAGSLDPANTTTFGAADLIYNGNTSTMEKIRLFIDVTSRHADDKSRCRSSANLGNQGYSRRCYYRLCRYRQSELCWFRPGY